MGVSDMKLSRRDIRILKFAAQAGGTDMDRFTLEQIANDSGCTVEFIHKRLSDFEFRNLFFETLKTSLAVETPAILQKFVMEAKSGSFKHGKLILELAGLYNEETNVNVNANVTVGESPFRSAEDRSKFLQATLKEYLPEEE